MLDSCFSIYQISCVKMKKGIFCKLKPSLSRELCSKFKNISPILSSALCWFSMKIIIYLPVKNDKPKFVAFLIFVCTTASNFPSNFVFRKCLETRRHLGSGRKKVNIQRYSELREPIKKRKNCYSLIWILNGRIAIYATLNLFWVLVFLYIAILWYIL